MLKVFYPSLYASSAYEIPYEELYKKGYRGIIYDVDNTLVPHGAPADEAAILLFQRLRALGFSTCILSNNKKPRVAPFAGQVGSPFIEKGGKPKRAGYERAMARMGTNRSNTLFIGDQLFTDIWGANRTGLYSILVKPINPKEEIQIVLKRRLEAVVLWFYFREHPQTARQREKAARAKKPGGKE